MGVAKNLTQKNLHKPSDFGPPVGKEASWRRDAQAMSKRALACACFEPGCV